MLLSLLKGVNVYWKSFSLCCIQRKSCKTFSHKNNNFSILPRTLDRYIFENNSHRNVLVYSLYNNKKNDLLLLFKWIFREYISVLIQFQNKHIWFFASCSWIYQWFARAIFLFYINLSVSCRVSICKILFLMSSPFEKKPVF